MKLHFLLTSLLTYVFVATGYGQLNTDYFNQLSSKQVTSSNKLEWTQIGPGMAGYCEEFWCHPTDANSLFMSPDMGNSYGSWDGGKSYKTIKDYDGSGQDLQRIQQITFSHQNANFGLAIDKRGDLFKTTNRGRSWTPMNFDSGGRHSELVVDPSNDNIWYMGAGDFWNVKANHRSAANKLGNVYKYAKYGHIYKSTDKGETWSKLSSGLPNTLDVGRIIVNPKNSNVVIAATNSGVYRSSNGGATWNLSGSGLPNNLPRDMTYYYNKSTNEFILYVVEQTHYIANGNTVKAKGGVYKSTDTGKNWTSITGNLAINLNSINYYAAKDKYYNAIAHWFGITKDAAKSQYPTLPSSIYSVFNRIKVNPNNKNEIYLSHNVKHDKAFPPGDVWMTSNGGTNWIASARSGKYWKDKTDKAYWQGRGNPIGMNITYAHLHSEMEHSYEYQGNRFLELNASGSAFICIDQQTLRSDDNGDTWQQVDDFETSTGSQKWVGRGDSNLPGRFIIFGKSTNRHLFCSGEHGLWQQKDAGSYDVDGAVAMKQIDGQSTEGYTSISTAAVHPNNSNTLYSLIFRQTGRGYFRVSTDGGVTWTDKSQPITYSENVSTGRIFQYSLTVDNTTPNNIYFCVPSNPAFNEVNPVLPSDFTATGVYRSTDGGNTWAIKNSGLPNGASVRRLAMHPSSTTTLYAALNQESNGDIGGLYKTTNKGNAWTKVTIPSNIKAVNDVWVDKKSEAIFIACGRKNGTVNEGGVWKSTNGGSSWSRLFKMPFVTQVATSPLDSDIVTVVVAYGSNADVKINPGAYLSHDGGSNWIKINKNLGQPDMITDLKPDPYNKNVFWCALFGSGWAKGIYSNTSSEVSDGAIISMKNVGSGKYVSSENGLGSMSCDKSTVESAEKFTLEYLDNNLYALKGNNGKYVSSENGTKEMTCTRTSIGAWEKFSLLEISTNVYALKGNNDAYVRGNMLCTQTASPSTWQQFEFSYYSTKSATGISESDLQNELTIYPNPTSSSFTIELKEAKNTSLSIFNMRGQMVYAQMCNDSKITLAANQFAKGTYIVKAKSANDLAIQKLIIK